MDFNKLIEDNKNNVQNIIRLITKEYNEDLEQEVYIKAWQNRDKYKEQGKLKSWLNVIAKNLSKDYLKSAKNKYETNSENNELILELVKDKKQTPEEQFSTKQRQILTTKAINSLKPKFKEVIILFEIEGKSHEEISKRINCPIGTVKSRIYCAKKELYEKLKNLI